MLNTHESGILVTGVTGLLGGEILRELQLRGRSNLAALVRGNGKESPAERFRHRMERSGSFGHEIHDTTILEGDIAKSHWGLSASDYCFMSEQIGTIVHCAADTSFIREDSVAETNIRGTENLIRLAESLPVPPRIVYLSTATNVGCVQHCRVEEEDGCQFQNTHFNKYTHSKAIAESMLQRSGLEVLVVRPTIVLSAGINDCSFARNILWFAPLLYEFDMLPIDPDGRMDLVSSAFVAAGTVELMQAGKTAHDCFHISAGEEFSVTTSDVLATFNNFYGRRPPVLIPPDEWTAADTRRCVRTPQQRQIFHALRYYLPFLNMDVIYDNSRFYQTLELNAPHFDRFDSYAHQLLQQIETADALVEAAMP